MKFKKLSTKLTSSFLLLAIVPLIVATAILVPLNLWRLKNAAKEYRLAVADNAKEKVLGLLSEARTEAQTIGTLLTQKGLTLEDYRYRVSSLIKSAHYVDIAAIYNPKGQLVSTFQDADSHLVVSPPPQLAMHNLSRAIAQTIVYLPLVKKELKKIFLPFVVPIYLSKRKIFGYIWSVVALDTLNRTFGELSALRFDKQKNHIFLIDKNLQIIVHASSTSLGQPLHPSFSKQEINLHRAIGGYAFNYTKQGRELLVAIEPIAQLQWGVVVEQDQAKAYAVIRNTWQTALIVGLLAILFAIAVGLWLGKTLSRPILAIAQAAKQVAQGDFGIQIPVTSHDEVGTMALSFNRMARDLDSYEKKLIEETRIRAELGRYLDEKVINKIIERKQSLELGGKRQKVTVLFADIVSFTPLTKAHPPERIVAILNELFTFLTEIIFKHHGIVDKFIGDCVMATFGVPEAGEEDALEAVRAAEEMMRWLEVGNARWKEELGASLQLGIGINTGEALVGNIGSKKRMEYTVIGETVNIAARLESFARAQQILMTRTTADEVQEEFDVLSLGFFELAGLDEKIEIFTLDE